MTHATPLLGPVVAALLALACLACAPAGGNDSAAATEPAGAEATMTGDGDAVPVVVELFTSQGCSSCPPADRVFSKLRADPDLRGRIVPLAFHVDYWNRLGWRDPFSSERWSERQRDYARSWQASRVYTPQLVVGGREDVVGSKEGQVRTLVAEGLERPAVPLTLEVAAGETADQVVVRAAPRGEITGLEGGVGKLWVALTESGLSTEVDAGENARRTLHHDAVVRRLEPVGPSGEVTLTLDPAWDRDELRVAAFAQHPESREIRGAAGPVPVP